MPVQVLKLTLYTATKQTTPSVTMEPLPHITLTDNLLVFTVKIHDHGVLAFWQLGA